jgi:CubicO group peptidase (beta-lactamase class C family)
MKIIHLAALVALAVCEMAYAQPDYLHADEPIGTVRQIYDGALMPDLQANTFRNIDRLFPTRLVKKGTRVFPLPDSKEPVTTVHFNSGDKDYDLYDYLSLNRISGLVVIKNGQIVLQTYQLGNTEKTRWMSMSVVKSITATLVGAAVKEGYIKSIDDPVTHYLPELKTSAYEGVSVRNLLQMTSGVQWNETYTDPGSDRRRMLEAQIAQQPGELLALMSRLPRAAEPGTRWNYSTGETQVVAALVEAATHRPVAEYLSERIWAKFGMESDATWWLESPDGLEIGGSGLSATLRDYARFGLFLLNGGIAGGEQILPDDWLEQATSPKIINGSQVDYGFMLWPVPESKGAAHTGAFEALGIFGQRIYVNPDEDLVIALWSAWPKPMSFGVVDDHDFFAALCRILRERDRGKFSTVQHFETNRERP